jgi:hypothetical protein
MAKKASKAKKAKQEKQDGCHNCFFNRQDTCRRHAPKPRLIAKGAETAYEYDVVWPPISDWCGEHHTLAEILSVMNRYEVATVNIPNNDKQ